MVYIVLAIVFMVGFTLGLLTLSRIARKSAGRMKLCSSFDFYRKEVEEATEA